MQSIKLVHIMADAMSLLFLRGQLAFMKDNQIEITAITSPSETLTEVAKKEEIAAWAIPISRQISPWTDVKSIFKLMFYLRKHKPHIVHAHTPKGGLIGMCSSFLARVPIRIYHMRGLPLMTATGLTRRLLWTSEWLCCKLAHQVFCVSHSLKEVAIAEKITQSSKLKVIKRGSGNGVDAWHQFNPEKIDLQLVEKTRMQLELPQDAVILGFVGRLVKDKGVYELLEAFRNLQPNYPYIYLLLVGPLEKRDGLSEDTIDYIKTHPNIRWVGAQKDLPTYYKLMDIVLFPSYREGFPNVPLEAAAMELPIVASQIPGCIDVVVSGESGFLYPLKNQSDFEGKIQKYLEDKEMRLQHGRYARAHVLQHFLPKDIWQGYLDTYHQLYQEKIDDQAFL